MYYMLLRSSQRGLFIALCCTSLIVGSLGEAVHPSAPVLGRCFLQVEDRPVLGKKIALRGAGFPWAVEEESLEQRTVVSKKVALLTKGPGFFRGAGVRSGVEEDSLGVLGENGAHADSNPWMENMAYRFDRLDNLEPTAPMDSLNAAVGGSGEPGEAGALFVPQYLVPHASAVVPGKGCNCTTPPEKNKPIQCSCEPAGEESPYVDASPNTLFKYEPIVGTNNFTLKPADMTYHGGTYMGPMTRDGLVSPADALPTHQYPNQAMADEGVHESHHMDRLPAKFNRYLDQVHDRLLECNTVSKRCTVPCRPGDDVNATIGNLLLKSKVVRTFVGNEIQVKFKPFLAAGASDAAECPLPLGCTPFRFCKTADNTCRAWKDVEKFNWAGSLFKTHQCPPDTKVCKEVHQVVTATLLTKGDKTCRASAR